MYHMYCQTFPNTHPYVHPVHFKSVKKKKTLKKDRFFQCSAKHGLQEIPPLSHSSPAVLSQPAEAADKLKLNSNGCLREESAAFFFFFLTQTINLLWPLALCSMEKIIPVDHLHALQSIFKELYHRKCNQREQWCTTACLQSQPDFAMWV